MNPELQTCALKSMAVNMRCSHTEARYKLAGLMFAVTDGLYAPS